MNAATLMLIVGLLGPLQAESRRVAVRILEASTGDLAFAVACERIAALGTSADDRDAEALLVRLLGEEASLYRGRPAAEVRLLRGAAFSALARGRPPAESLARVRGELATGDDPYVFGAAARVAAALGPAAGTAATDLTRAFRLDIKDESFSLEDPSQAVPLRQPTTARVEALYALAAIGPGARPARDVVAAVADGTIVAGTPDAERLRDLAARALAAIDGPDCCCGDLPDPTSDRGMIAVSSRVDPKIGSIELADHRGGRFRLDSLRGGPVLLVFFYTRCDNPFKCPRAVTNVAALCRRWEACGPTSARVVLVTLDPLHDDPDRLRSYAESRGLADRSRAHLARAGVAETERIARSLGLPVNFEAGRVNAHGPAAVWLDRGGRVARFYPLTGWEADQAAGDAHHLVNEP